MSFPENISSTHLAFDSAASNVTSNRFNRLHHAAVFLCHLLSVPKEKNNQVVKSNLTALTSAAASWRMVINGEARNPFDNDQYVHLRLKVAQWRLCSNLTQLTAMYTYICVYNYVCIKCMEMYEHSSNHFLTFLPLGTTNCHYFRTDSYSWCLSRMQQTFQTNHISHPCGWPEQLAIYLNLQVL